MVKRSNYLTNPYRVVVGGLMIPPFTNAGSELYLVSDTLGFILSVSDRYPIVVCRRSLRSLIQRMLLPDVMFAPRTLAVRPLRPLILKRENIDYSKWLYQVLVPTNNPANAKADVTIATRNISLVDIVRFREYTPRSCRGTSNCNLPTYLAAQRIRIRSKISASELSFLGNVEVGNEVNYRGLTFHINGQLESLGDMLNLVRNSVGLTSSFYTRRITTIVMFARNQLFVNANEPVPLSNDSRYTVARITCRGNPLNLLIIDWDDDLFSLHYGILPLYDLLEVGVSELDEGLLQP